VSAAGFVERFAAAWADPSPDRLNGLLHPDVRLVQPLEGEVRGHAGTTAMWQRTFGLIPDLRGEVLDWAERGDFLVVSIRLHGTLGRRPVEWVSSDHIRLEDGLVRERIAHFDPLPIAGALATSPRLWPRYVALQARRLRAR
jgi:SnoaL-like domain